MQKILLLMLFFFFLSFSLSLSAPRDHTHKHGAMVGEQRGVAGDNAGHYSSCWGLALCHSRMVGTSCTLANQAVKAPPKAYPRLLSRWEVYGTAADDIAGGGFNRAPAPRT